MLQLVGQKCVLCEKRIDSILEGKFCTACRCPIHLDCRKKESTEPDTCLSCGAPLALGAEHRKVQQEETATRDQDIRGYHLSTGTARIGLGLLCVIGGIVGSLLSFLLAKALCLFYVVFPGIIIAGLGMIANGVTQLQMAKRMKIEKEEEAERGAGP